MSKEDRLRVLAQKPSNTEEDRIERTKRLVTEAIKLSSDPRVKNATVFAKGSVKMKTNIRKYSDIDICVQANDVFYADYPEGKNNEEYGNVWVSYTFADFRRAVEDAISEYFEGSEIDTSGNKAIRIHSDHPQGRVDADVVPAFEHRRYYKTTSAEPNIGIELQTKDGRQRIINWPHHNYRNSLAKHDQTGRRYRKMVRVLKNIRALMEEANISSAQHGHSFLIESLLWNTPHGNYGYPYYEQDLDAIFDYLEEQLTVEQNVKEWGEVNELKYLFRPTQKWTTANALEFVRGARQFTESLS